MTIVGVTLLVVVAIIIAIAGERELKRYIFSRGIVALAVILQIKKAEFVKNNCTIVR